MNDRQSKAAQARQEAVAAESKSKQLGAFTDFASIKEQRLASVMAAAQTRFDWERFMRELARVMPAGSWVHTTNASVAGDTSVGSPRSAATTAAVPMPEANLVGLHAAPVRGRPHDGAPRADVPRDGRRPERVRSGVRLAATRAFRAAETFTSST